LDREIVQLKALVSQLESRKRQQQNNNSQEQILVEERDRDNDFDETSLLSDEVNRTIIDFVESKRQEKVGGPNQTQIVEKIQKKCATMTGTSRPIILKRIEYLVQRNVLIERRDAKYNQQRYYVNEESLLLKTQRFFDELEAALINLVKALIERRGAPIEFQTQEENLFFLVIFKLYNHVINIVVTEATLEWPKITNDTVLLNMSYRALFAKLVKLQENFSRVLDKAGLEAHDIFFNNSWLMTPDLMFNGWILQNKLKLKFPEDRVHLLFNLAWSIGAPYVRYALEKLGKPDDPKIVDKWSRDEGWVDVVRYWVKQQKDGFELKDGMLRIA
jgi:hypothetical protein